MVPQGLPIEAALALALAARVTLAGMCSLIVLRWSYRIEGG